VNLFKHAACPIELTHMTPDYALLADGVYADVCDIYSVDKVTTVQKSRHGQTLTEFRPYYSLRHGEAGGRHGRYYVVRRDELAALRHPGHATRIALVDLDLDPLDIADASVSIELTCTNRDLPSRLCYDTAGGDLKLEQATDGYPLRFLRRPTPQYRFNAQDHWRLIAHLSLSHCALSADGLHLLQETLTLYDLPQSSVSQRQIAGIVALEQRETSLWLRDDGHSALVRGLAVRVTLDEDAFAGTGIDLFVSVLDHFFGLYVHCQSFTQLTVFSHASGKELIRCHPRNGARKLV
jgi:type VI secretion system protein ImpG